MKSYGDLTMEYIYDDEGVDEPQLVLLYDDEGLEAAAPPRKPVVAIQK